MARTPRSAAQLGLVEQAIGALAEAELHLSEALASKDAWIEANRGRLESSRAYVRGRLGKVRLLGAPADTTIAVGSDPAFKVGSDAVAWLPPGTSTLVIQAPGHTSLSRQVTVKMGESVTVALEQWDGAAESARTPPPVIAAAPPSAPTAAAPTAASEGGATPSGVVSPDLHRDNQRVHNNQSAVIYTIPSGPSIAAGGYLVLEPGAGLQIADIIQILDATGAAGDGLGFSSEGTVTRHWFRCPNGRGAWDNNTAIAATKGRANTCP